VPIGGTLAALVASAVLPAFGWRALFVVGGVSPILMAVVLFFALPESPGYLASAPARWGEPLRFLFSADYRRDTCALFIAFASCLLAVYLGFNWIPAMLTGAGIDVATASTGLAAFNLGGVAGAIAAAMIIVRIGSRSTIMGMAVAAGLSAAAMSAMPITPGAAGSAVLMLGLTGGLINAVQITMYALAAHVYPVAVRATGVGSAASVGRLGAVFSTYAGAWALERGGTSLFFIVVAAAMAVVLVSLGMVSRHIPAEAATGASPSSSLRSRR
jgi:AAHS family 4-hydroxybenzoate transporter-like MFS transporter